MTDLLQWRSLAQAKAHLSELVAQVRSRHDRVTVALHGQPVAVLMALEELEALEKTFAVLSNATGRCALDTVAAELAAGAVEDEDTLAAAMAARRASA